MFFILGLTIIILLILIILICNSKIQVRIFDLDISTQREKKIKDNFKTYIDVLIFNNIKILSIDIKKIIKIKKVNTQKVFQNVIKAEKSLSKDQRIEGFLKSIKDLKLELKKFDLQLEIGTENAALTAITVGIISSIISIILRNQTLEAQRFKILPIYKDKNILNIKLDCIFRINLIHYIYRNILKRREENERKSSDRRTYAYSNE